MIAVKNKSNNMSRGSCASVCVVQSQDILAKGKPEGEG